MWWIVMGVGIATLVGFAAGALIMLLMVAWAMWDAWK